MDNLFYQFGILYFIVSAYNFFTYNHNRDVSVYADTNISDLVDETVTIEEKPQEEIIKKHYPRHLLGLMVFVWTYIGCVGNFPEKKFFIFNMLVLLTYCFILIIMGFSLALNAYTSLKDDLTLPEKEKSKKKYIPLTKIIYFLEMVIVGSIITIHYLIL